MIRHMKLCPTDENKQIKVQFLVVWTVFFKPAQRFKYLRKFNSFFFSRKISRSRIF